jgi:hypothetical protein
MISRKEFLDIYEEFPLNTILDTMSDDEIEALYQKVKDEFE